MLPPTQESQTSGIENFVYLLHRSEMTDDFFNSLQSIKLNFAKAVRCVSEITYGNNERNTFTSLFDMLWGMS